MRKKILVRGGGDLASAVIQKLYRSGFQVVVCELKKPKTVRRAVAFSSAVYEKAWTVEGIEGIFAEKIEDIYGIINQNKVPVTTISEQIVKEFFQPDVFVDATLSKKNADYDTNYASLVIGLGPGICSGKDAHVVIETNRGHNLGRLIFKGFAIDNTHVPGDIVGYTYQRVLRAPCDGKIFTDFKIGDFVEKNDVIMTVNGVEVKTEISGVIRGLIHESVNITRGLKLGDVDPRGDRNYCFTVSDKGRNIAGGVLEAILIWLNQ
jgi:xanthine dehydrogenase accessory factor